MSDRGGSDAWRDVLTASAAALIVAVLDGDTEGVNAILGTCTRDEAAQIALTLAQGLVACCEPEDRAGLRETGIALLQSGQLAG